MPEPIAGLLRKSAEHAEPNEYADEVDAFAHYEIDSCCEVLIFNNRDEAVQFQMQSEEDGWRGSWSLIDVQEKRTSL